MPTIDLNGAGAGTSETLNYTEGDGATVITSSATVVDPDSPNFDGGTLTVEITANGTATDQIAILPGGQITTFVNEVRYNGTTIGTYSGGGGTPLVIVFDVDATPTAVQALVNRIAYFSNTDAPSTLARTVTYTLTDGDGGTGNATATINVSGVNDAPSGTDNAVTGIEDTPYVFQVSDFGFTDVDGNAFLTVTLTTVPTTGTIFFDPDGVGGVDPFALSNGATISAANIAAGRLYYQPGANGNGLSYASFTFQVTDDGGTANGGQDTDQTPNTLFINITPANDRPLVDLNGAGAGTSETLNYTEGDGATVITSSATVVDPDSPNFDGGTLTVEITANGTATDQIAILPGGQITTFVNEVRYNGTTIGTYSGGGGTPLVIVFDVDATPTAVQALVNRIAYFSNTDAPSTLARTVTYTLTDGDGGTGNATATINVTSDEINGTAGDDILIGTPQPDTMNGLDGNDAIYGMASNDTMDGGAGNDYLDGGPGSDTMTGGTGNDRYVVEASDTIVELDGEGIDIVYARTSFALMAGVSIELLATVNYLATDAIDLTGNELNNAITGNNGNNTLKGGAGDDYLTGLEGADFLDGGLGVDIMVGGVGNDRYIVDNAGDRIVESAGQGFDIVYSSVSYTLTAGAEVEMLAARNGAGTDAIDLTGNEFNNVVQGNDGANTLNGGAGDDSVIGLGGDDTIDGGAGRDILSGGSGADTFRFALTSHSAPGAGDRIMDFVSGTDRIDLSAIDANTLLAGDQAFTFIGTAAFSGTAGELRYDVVGGRMHIYGDVNGDGLVDMHIAADGTIVTASDFIL